MSTFLMRLIAFVKGEFGAMMRRPEGRRFLLEACLWEAGDVVESEYREVEVLRRDLDTLQGQVGRLKPRVEALNADVDRALNAGASSIAETLMGRLLPLSHTLKELEDGVSELEDAIGEREALIEEQEGALLLLRAQAQGVLRGRGQAEVRRGSRPPRDEVLWALEKRRREL